MRGIHCTGLDGATAAGLAFDVFGIGSAASGIAQAAGSVAGATIQAAATRDAAKMATDSANRSADLVQGRYDTTRGDLLPYQQTGQAAQPWLQNNLGLYNYDGSDYTGMMARDNPNGTLGGVQVPGMQNNAVVPGRMDEATLRQTPGYQFALSQGLQATQNSAAARGLGVSGAALKGAATFATGLADNTYQQQFNQLQTQFSDQLSKDNQNFGQGQNIYTDQYQLGQGQFGQAQQRFANDQNIGAFDQTGRSNSENRLLALGTLGANAAAQTGQQGTLAATAAGNYLTAGASGAAAGTIAGGNAIAGGFNGVGNAFQNYQQQQMLQQYLNGQQGVNSLNGAGLPASQVNLGNGFGDGNT